MLIKFKQAAVATVIAGMVASGSFAVAPPAGAAPAYERADVHLVRSGRGWNQNWNRGGGHGHYHGGGYYYPRYYGYYPRYYGYNWMGPALGFGAGVVFGSILVQPRYYYAPRYSNRDAYCHNKYRSYNSRTGTFTGYDGRQHYCRIP